MHSAPVQFSGTPFNGMLMAWGRDQEHWWGLVRFEQQIRYLELTERRLECAAWMPAERLRQPIWSGGRRPAITRLVLPDDCGLWPAPAAGNWQGWYAGIWETGTPPLPPGIEPLPWSTRSTSKRRNP